jgi:adenylate cyclase
VGIGRSARNPNLCNRCNTHVDEGRVVELTVLFADLSGFTAMTRQHGPERTHAVVDAFLKSATYTPVRRGAFIDKYVGDAVMAFFNAPIRYEDHAARALAAAHEIEAEMPALSTQFGIDLKAAIGVASGWAHVGRLGSGDGKDYTAIGDVVNLAARLEGQAHCCEVVVDEPVYRQVAV